MRVRVKICGVTTAVAARAAVEAGADAVGFVFANSPRQVSTAHATELAQALPAFITRVAVMRNPTREAVEQVLREFRPDMLQTEVTAAVALAIANRHSPVLPVVHDDDSLDNQLTSLRASGVAYQTILLEGPGRGGRGVSPDWTRAESLARQSSLVLAGGLNPENVETAIRTVQPFGVDVSSGVEERPGVKSPRLIVDFIAAVRHAERQMENVNSV